MANVYSRQLPDIVTQLDNYAELANNATSLSEFNSYKSEYESLLDRYSMTVDSSDKIMQAKKVAVLDVDIPNPKDINQWLAGGTLKNETFAGGSGWSPTAKPNIINNRKGTDKNALLLSGQMLPYLSFGFGDILRTIDDFSNLQSMFQSDNRVASVYKINIAVSSTDGVVYEKSSSDIILGDGQDATTNMKQSLATSTMTLNEIAEAWNNRRDIKSMLGANPLTIILTIYDVLTNDRVTVEQRLTGALLGTVYNTFKSLAMKGIAQMANITAMSPAVMIGFGLLGAIIDEIVEMVIGIDREFGLGGGLDTTGSFALGKGVFSKYDGILGLGTVVDYASYAIGMSETFGYDLVSKSGNLEGYFGKGYGIEEYYDLDTGDSVQSRGGLVDSIMSGVEKSFEDKQRLEETQRMLEQLNNLQDYTYDDGGDGDAGFGGGSGDYDSGYGGGYGDYGNSDPSGNGWGE